MAPHDALTMGCVPRRSAVARGEELSLAYVDTEQSAEERRMQLQHWGFECRCPRCKEEGCGGEARQKDAGAESSERRAQKRKMIDAEHPECSSQSPTGAAESDASSRPLVVRDRPLANSAIEQRVLASAVRRTGDWRYSLMPGVVPVDTMVQLSRNFFDTTGLLIRDGNTFGPDFERMYTGHLNYFYYMNRNMVVRGAEGAAHIFEQLDPYTRQVVELHHPGVAVRLDRAFGAYYEGNRKNFHLGCSEHCDGDTQLVSTVVHAVLPDGDCGFARGGELTVSAADGLPSLAITHSNDTVGSVVYMGGAVHHLASPIEDGGRRLVFCMFYACDAEHDLAIHALA